MSFLPRRHRDVTFNRLPTAGNYLMKINVRRSLILICLLAAVLWPAATQAQFTFTTNNGALTVTHFSFTIPVAVIPAITNGMPVVSIGDSAFYQKSTLASVTIPYGITNIGNSAFLLCGLTNVAIPDSVASVGSNLFYNCTSLINALLGTNLLNIGTNMFYGCTKLVGVSMSSGATNIGDGAFYSCSSLTNLVIANGVIGIGNSAFKSCSKLTSLTIPDTTIGIGNSAFQSCASLTNAPMGTNVISIGSSAFSGTSLTNIIVPDGVASIGDSAFGGCSKLIYASIGNGVTNMGNQVFAGDTSLASVLIGTNVISIGLNTFNVCTSLTNIIIPNSVTYIGPNSFYNCANLPRINVPAGVTNIDGIGVFGYCRHLTAIMVDPLNKFYSSVDGVFFDKSQATLIICPEGKAGSYTVPESVTSIGGSAFFQCSGLTGIYFQSNAPIFGSSAFSGDTATIYYLPGTTGWGATYGSLPTVLWNPQAQTGDDSFGVLNNQFGFNITGSSNLVIVVEAATNLSSAVWSPVSTNTLNTFTGTNGSSYFSDPQWTNFPGRFYRFRSP
jgi:hypothetical protein